MKSYASFLALAASAVVACAAELNQLTPAEQKDGWRLLFDGKSLDGWKAAGLPTRINRSAPIDLQRQVQIGAGMMVLAGVVLGPYTPGFVADQHMAEQLAEIGVILLMFGVGLQFHVEELLAVRRVAIPGALVQSAVATILGATVAHAFGWPWSGGLVFGLALSVASTVVLIRVLTDARHLHTPAGHIAVGWLVVEDVLTVVMLVLMPPLIGGPGQGDASGASGASGLARTLAIAAVKVGDFSVATTAASAASSTSSPSTTSRRVRRSGTRRA